ncbi:MAG: LysR family transcriptional regulator [Cyanobacteria bacterium J06642_2]
MSRPAPSPDLIPIAFETDSAIATPNLKVSQLRALVATIAAGNFSEAALRLGVTQSSISHAIASLEEELGVRVLLRGRHGAKPTPVGERIAARAESVLHLLGDIALEARRERGLEAGRIRIAAFRSVATHVLPAAIAQFNRQWPNVMVAIEECQDEDDSERALRQGKADIGFVILPVSDEFEAWCALRDECVALVPHASAPQGDRISWQQLAASPLFVPKYGSCSRVVRQALARSPVSLTIAREVQEESTSLSLVGQGLGIAIHPQLAVEPVPNNVAIRRLPVIAERQIGAVIAANAVLPHAVYAFLDVLKAQRPPDILLPAPEAIATSA